MFSFACMYPTIKVRDSAFTLGKYKNLKQILDLKHYCFDDFACPDEALEWARKKAMENADEFGTKDKKPPKGVKENGDWPDEEYLGSFPCLHKLSHPYLLSSHYLRLTRFHIKRIKDPQWAFPFFANILYGVIRHFNPKRVSSPTPTFLQPWETQP